MIPITYFMNEFFDDSFVKKYSIDTKYDFDSIDAKVVDGLLTLTLPYTADVKPRKIKVN